MRVPLSVLALLGGCTCEDAPDRDASVAPDAGQADAEATEGGGDAGAADAGRAPRWIGPLDPGGGGQVQDIEVHPEDDDIVYVLINSGGLSRSRDGGETWEVLNRGLDYGGAGFRAAGGVFLGMHPAHPDVLLRSSQDATIYVSTDAGDSWRPSYENPDIDDEYADFSYDPTDPDVVYTAVGGNNSILTQDYASRRVRGNILLQGRYDPDSAEYTWRTLMEDLGPLEREPVLSLDVERDGEAVRLLMTSPSGLHRGLVEDDTVRSLEPLNDAPGLPAADELEGTNVVVDDRTPGRIYLAVGNRANTSGGVYRSDDGGSTFVPLTDLSGYDPLGTGDLNNRFFALAVSPMAPEVIYASMVKFGEGRATAGGTLMRSVDDGATWEPMALLDRMTLGWKDYGERPHRFSVTNVAPSAVRQDVVYMSTSSGSHLFRSDDAGSDEPHWTVRSTRPAGEGRWSAGYPAIAFQWSIAVHPTDPSTLVVPYGDHGIFVSHDAGRSFALEVENDELGETYGGTLVIDEREPSVWYFALQGPHMELEGGAVMRFEGSGSSWRYLGGEPDAERGFPRGAATSVLVEYGEGASRTLYATNYGGPGAPGGVYRSVDGGDFERIFAVEGSRSLASRGDFGSLYVGADGAGLFGLTRDGDDWTAVPICESGAAGCPSTFYSMRGGGPWASVLVASDIGLLAIGPDDDLSVLWPGQDVWDVAVHPRDEQLLYLATDRGDGVLRSANGGRTWESVTDDLPTLNTMRLAFDPVAPDTILVGTKSAGIWRREGP